MGEGNPKLPRSESANPDPPEANMTSTGIVRRSQAPKWHSREKLSLTAKEVGRNGS